MIIDKKQIKESIKTAIQNINNLKNLSLKTDDDAKIYGPSSDLDSLALVSLLIEVEELVSAQINRPLNLMDEKAMSRYKSPFNTIESLTNYISNLISEGENE
jgi:acyl carrier protein